jgi:hypothetical protein
MNLVDASATLAAAGITLYVSLTGLARAAFGGASVRLQSRLH